MQKEMKSRNRTRQTHIPAGFDRLMALVCQSNSLRDVIAFPKSFHGRDLLTGAPSDIDAKELATYHIISASKKS